MFFDFREPDDDLYDNLDPDLDDIPDLEYLDEELFKSLRRERNAKEKAVERENQRWRNKKRRRERQNKYESGWDD